MPGAFDAVAAFFGRILRRTVSGTIRVTGESLGFRATEYLARLDAPQDSLRFRIAMQNLSRELDLHDEAATENEAVMRLQTRILELAADNPFARRIAAQMLNEPPSVKVFTAAIALVVEENADKLRIQFPRVEDPIIRVETRKDAQWIEAFTLPQSLENPLRGHIRRVEHAGFETIRPYVETSKPLPESLDFDWPHNGLVEISIG